MEEVSKGGRTIVLVSHQMNQIRRLCQRCIWVDGGKIRLAGSMLEVISAYESSFSSLATVHREGTSEQKPSTRFLSWRIAEPLNKNVHVLNGFGNVSFEFSLAVNEEIRDGLHGVALYNSDHQLIWATSVNKLTLNCGLHALRFKLPSLPIRPGVYHWQVSIWQSGHCLDLWTCVPHMIVGTKPVTHPDEQWQGVLNTPWEFQTERRDHSIIGQEESFTSQ